MWLKNTITNYAVVATWALFFRAKVIEGKGRRGGYEKEGSIKIRKEGEGIGNERKK